MEILSFLLCVIIAIALGWLTLKIIYKSIEYGLSIWFLLNVVLSISITASMVYIAYHFITKYW